MLLLHIAYNTLNAFLFSFVPPTDLIHFKLTRTTHTHTHTRTMNPTLACTLNRINIDRINPHTEREQLCENAVQACSRSSFAQISVHILLCRTRVARLCSGAVIQARPGPNTEPSSFGDANNTTTYRAFCLCLRCGAPAWYGNNCKLRNETELAFASSLIMSVSYGFCVRI